MRPGVAEGAIRLRVHQPLGAGEHEPQFAAADLVVGGGQLGRGEGAVEPGRWDGASGAGVVARVIGAGVAGPGLVAAHCVRLGHDDPAVLARAGIGVAHCPRSNAYLRCGRAPLEALWAAGVAVGLGTDSPASEGDYDLRAEARACRLAHRGTLDLDDITALRLITIDAARAIGLDHEVGSLEPGKRADLVSLGALTPTDDPYAAALHADTTVRAVVVEGEVLLHEGSPSRVDAAEIRSYADEARGRLC